jgi:iron(III) transport system ATP-binding protein
MSVNIIVKDAVKRYGDNTVIKNLSVDIREGEFFTLLGPSGCGKTTLLRMIAGFNSIEGGDFYFNERRINNMEPSDRNIGMVFQNYAIFPHMSVYENVAFGLKNRKISKEEVNRRVLEMLDIMQITEYKDRLPEKLSGGQQQRVALARAVVIQPDVLLMDEPLSNLDAKLRVDMRTAIKEIQQRVNITTVYVTHDQEEAMSVSDRIAVMNQGIIQHTGTPQNIYQRPQNIFVATFIGRSNILDGDLVNANNDYSIDLGLGSPIQIPKDYFTKKEDSQRVKVSIRPEEFVISKEKGILKGEVKTTVFLGLNTHYVVILEDGQEVDVVEESSIKGVHHEGEIVFLNVKSEKINIFNESGNQNLVEGVVNDNA